MVVGGHLAWIILLFSVCNAAIMSAWIMSIQETRFSELVGDFSFKPFSRVCLFNLWDLLDLDWAFCVTEIKWEKRENVSNGKRNAGRDVKESENGIIDDRGKYRWG